jgi:hypothetical protein
VVTLARVLKVEVTDDTLSIDLEDGRSVSVPIGWVSPSREWYTLESAGHKPEVHIFSSGGHGFGMRKQNTSSDYWIETFYYWLTAQGFTKS